MGMQKHKERTFLLRLVGLEWRVVDGATGVTLVVFSQAEYGRMWLRDAGCEPHGLMAGESRAEVWVKIWQ